eukprot:11208253-Alexandrium_andersonii.AAC.1
MSASLVGSEMCIRDSARWGRHGRCAGSSAPLPQAPGGPARPSQGGGGPPRLGLVDSLGLASHRGGSPPTPQRSERIWCSSAAAASWSA